MSFPRYVDFDARHSAPLVTLVADHSSNSDTELPHSTEHKAATKRNWETPSPVSCVSLICRFNVIERIEKENRPRFAG